MAEPHGKATWQSHMAEPYGRPIWQSHMAAAAAAYVLRWTYETFFRYVDPENDMLKNHKYVLAQWV